MTIREFDASERDYQALADTQFAIFPDIPVVKEDYSSYDERHDPKYLFKRFITESNKKIIGVGWYFQAPWLYDPQRFFVQVRVLPEFQRKGVGTKLYDHIIKTLQPYNPNDFRTRTRDDIPDGITFIEKRGFKELIRERSSELDVASFDSSPFEGFENKLNEEGIRIKTLPELRDDQDWAKRLYNSSRLIEKDVPGLEESEISLEEWKKKALGNPELIQDAYFVAVDGDKYVGVSFVFKDLASDMLMTGLTGVTKEYRGKGIATAMKVKVIAYAKKHGNSKIRTGNEPNNPMLKINERLGFYKLPEWIDYIKKLDDNSSAFP